MRYAKLRSDLKENSYEFLRTILDPSLQLEPEFLTAPKSTKSHAPPLKTMLWREEATLVLDDCFLDLPFFKGLFLLLVFLLVFVPLCLFPWEIFLAFWVS